MLPQEWIGVKVASTEHHHIHLVLGPISEVSGLTDKLLDQRPLLDGGGPLEAHGF